MLIEILNMLKRDKMRLNSKQIYAHLRNFVNCKLKTGTLKCAYQKD